MFSPAVVKQIEKTAHEIDVEPAALLAVAEVESAGVASWNVNGDSLPPIRFEGHYFYRLLKGKQRDAAVAAGLASPKAGVVANPKSYKARYALLDRAMTINQEVAIESTSWGLGQVMGSHWKKLGFKNAEALAEMAQSGIAGQVKIMALYIQKFGLVDELQEKGFASFAKQYNGPAYKSNRYDTKMAAAYKRWVKANANVSSVSTVMPTKGADSPVMSIQRDLKTLKYYKGALDGKEGPLTIKAVKAFQRANGLVADGKYGKLTDEAMDRALVKAGRKEGNSDIKVGTSISATGVAADMISAQADKLEAVSQYSQYIGYVVSILICSGVALALWGLWQKYQTGVLEEDAE